MMTNPDVEITVLEPIRWRSWPLGQSLVGSLIVLPGLAVLAMVVYWATAGIAMTALITLAMAISLWRFYLPVSFELNSRGVEQRLFGRVQMLPWQAIRRFRVGRGGVLLIPRGNRTEMAPFGSLYLPWNGNRERILLFVEHFLQEPSRRSLT